MKSLPKTKYVHCLGFQITLFFKTKSLLKNAMLGMKRDNNLQILPFEQLPSYIQAACYLLGKNEVLSLLLKFAL